jgi:hypothetical protein
VTIDLSTQREEFAAIAASELAVFSAAIADMGCAGFALRSRFVAVELRWVLEQLAAERSARQALQARCETLQEIVGRAGYRACVEEAAGR